MGLVESCPTVIRPAPIPSSRCDMTKKICEGREWTFANVCLFSQPCDRPASRRVTLESFKKSVRQLLFLSVVDNYMISYESAYSLLFVSGSWLFVYWRKWAETLQTHFSVSCADCGNCCLLILFMFYLLVSKTGCKITKISSESCSFMQFSFTSYWYFVVFTSKIYYLCH